MRNENDENKKNNKKLISTENKNNEKNKNFNENNKY